MSLATNLAVADALLRRRHRAVPGDGRRPTTRRVGRLRHTARAFGLDWPAEQSLGRVPALAADRRPAHAAFLLAVRRAGGGGALRAVRATACVPWHAAMAATYAHATAPLRRLADRYVVEAALAVADGRAGARRRRGGVRASCPTVMAAGRAAGQPGRRAVLDLAEAVVLAGREGEVFDAVVIDEDDRGARDPARRPGGARARRAPTGSTPATRSGCGSSPPTRRRGVVDRVQRVERTIG